jgi:hypothetical protein
MSFNYLHFLSIYILGEILLNLTFFNYLKKYFKVDKITSPDETNDKFLGFDISIFKGLLERLVLFFALTINLSQILIVYGAIKIGTRFEKNDKIKNDYFLIGNLSSIFFSIIYYYILNMLRK